MDTPTRFDNGVGTDADSALYIGDIQIIARYGRAPAVGDFPRGSLLVQITNDAVRLLQNNGSAWVPTNS